MGMQIESQLSEQIARYLDLSVNEAKLTAVNAKSVTTFDTVTQKTINMIH
jgi:hypothetical protein